MGSEALDYFREEVKKQGQVPVDLELKYTVVFSTLQGNLPINNQVQGSISGIPVDLELAYKIIPNTMGDFPVNTRLEGTIGDFFFEAEMPYKIVFSTIAGNIPVNSGIKWNSNGKVYHLEMSYSLVPAAARGGGGSESGGKKKRQLAPKFIRGKMVTPDELPQGEEKIPSEAGRPVCNGIYGQIEDIEIDINFHFTYYCNTSSGRNPVNVRAVGFLRHSST